MKITVELDDKRVQKAVCSSCPETDDMAPRVIVFENISKTWVGEQWVAPDGWETMGAKLVGPKCAAKVKKALGT